MYVATAESCQFRDGRDTVAVLDAGHVGYRGIEFRLHVAAGKRHQQGIRGMHGELQFPSHTVGLGNADGYPR